VSEELSRPSQSSSRRPPAAGAKGGIRVREEQEMERARSISRASSTLESVDSLDVPPDIFVEESDENGAIRMRRVTAGGKCFCLLFLLSNATCC
jgi:hypothetical protein